MPKKRGNGDGPIYRRKLEEDKEVQRLRQEIKWQEILEKHKQSPYLREQMEQLLEYEEGEKHLRELIRLRDLMIHLKKGYGSEAMGYLRDSLRDKYPLAYEAFKKELELG